jgi:hypothetical protein
MAKYSIQDWYYFQGTDCGQKIDYLLQGHAISMVITGGNPYFWYYKSGILGDCYGHYTIDHSVVLIGAHYDPAN